jgi:predicted PurR-regulated permease PerM
MPSKAIVPTCPPVTGCLTMRAEAYRWFARGLGLAVGVLVVLLIAGGLAVAARVVVLVFLAILFASALDPLIDRLRARLPIPRGAAVILIFTAFFAAVLGLALIVVPGAIAQFNDLGAQLAPVLADAREWAATIEPRSLSLSLTAVLEALEETLVPGPPTAPDPDDVIEIGITVADVAISLSAVLAMIYFWLTGRARLQRFALALLPEPRRAGTRDGWNEIELRLGSWVRAQLILMTAMGLATGVAYFLIGLEGAVLLALIAALAEAIPLVGPALGAIPALVVAAATGQIETVLLVAVVYVAIQTIESNVLVPVVMKNTVGVPAFLVVAGVLAGAAIGGIVGALVAVPMTAAFIVVLERMQARESPVPIEPASAAGAAQAAEEAEQAAAVTREVERTEEDTAAGLNPAR